MKLVLSVSILLGTCLFSGCAVQKKANFNPKSVTKIEYQPRDCKDLPDGRKKCNNVVFTVSTVEYK